MTDTLSNERTLNLLMNWKHWAKDDQPDPAEVDYYTVSATFSSVLPRGSAPPYDTESALMVEEVLKEMFVPYQPEWWILLAYYGKGMTQDEIGQRLGIHRTTVTKRRLPMARRIFEEQWSLLIRKT